jgi:hypothetical protein
VGRIARKARRLKIPAPQQSISYALPVILGIALALRLWGIGFGLPHTLARPDEDAVFVIALRFFGRTLNPGFFHWPSLFMYVVALMFVVYFNVGRWAGWFGYESSFIAKAPLFPAPLFLIARTVSAAAGVATVWTVHRLGVRLFDRPIALVGALLLAVAPLHVRDSHFGVTDIAATWLITLSFLASIDYDRGRRVKSAVLSAIWAGLATSTKYNAALIVLPALVVIARSGPSAAPLDHRLRLLGLYGVVWFVAFVIGTPYALLDWPNFVVGLREISDHLRSGHMAMAGYGWIVHLTSSLRYGLSGPLLAASLMGLALYCWRDWRNGWLYALFPVAYFLAIGGGQTAFARYIIPLLPFLCLAAGYVIVEAARTIAARAGKPSLVPGVIVALTIVVAAPALYASVRTNHLLTQTDSRLLAAQWMRSRFPGGVTMYQSGSIYGHVQMATVDPYVAALYPQLQYDDSRREFVATDGRAAGLPDVMVLQSSPLGYSSTADSILALAGRQYSLEESIQAVDAAHPSLVYDRDDAFFVPLAGFAAVTRPGPNLNLYVRRSEAP